MLRHHHHTSHASQDGDEESAGPANRTWDWQEDKEESLISNARRATSEAASSPSRSAGQSSAAEYNEQYVGNLRELSGGKLGARKHKRSSGPGSLGRGGNWPKRLVLQLYDVITPALILKLLIASVPVMLIRKPGMRAAV